MADEPLDVIAHAKAGLDAAGRLKQRRLPEASSTSAAVDPVQLLTCMKKLLDAQFEELLFVLDAPRADLPGLPASAGSG